MGHRTHLEKMATSTTRGTNGAPDPSVVGEKYFQDNSSSSELGYLKSLVSQLQEKISALESSASKAVSSVTGGSQDGVRMILIGPPRRSRSALRRTTSRL